MIDVANLSPAMIDGAVVQLRMVIENADGIPAKVRSTGKDFIDALDEWSAAKKAATENSTPQMQAAQSA